MSEGGGEEALEKDDLASLRSRVRELEELERELRRSDAILQAIAESSPDHLMLLDLDGNIRFINRPIQDLSVEHVLDTPVFRYVPDEFRGPIRDCFSRVIATRQADRCTVLYRAADGEVSSFESSVGPVIRRGKVVALSVVASNITERQRAEAERDQFFSLSLDLLCIATTSGYFKRINPAFVRILGHSQAELLALPFYQFVHPDDRSRTEDAVARLARGEEIIDFENRYRCADERYRWLSWRATAPAGRGLIYAVARDVTERRQLEEQLRQSQKMDAIGKLAGGVAHDFNNLISVILMNATLAMRDATTAPLGDSLGEIVKAGERAGELTKQLLAVSRTQIVRLCPIDLNQQVQELFQLLRRLIREDIELSFLPGDDLPLLMADAGQIQQVLMNLCLNARDALPDGGRIAIATEHIRLGGGRIQGEPPRDYVRLTVTDNGPGVPREIRDRVFEPFFTTKEPGQGTGLGLAIAYGIVSQHGGRLRLYGASPRGTVVEMCLPGAPGATADAPAPASAAVRRGTEAILVAEDEPAVRDAVTRLLTAEGYTVVTAVDGVDAVVLFEQNGGDISLVILDAIMPRMGGREAYERIKTLRPEVKVLFTSGYSDRDLPLPPNQSRYLLPKPYRPGELLSCIRELLGPTRED